MIGTRLLEIVVIFIRTVIRSSCGKTRSIGNIIVRFISPELKLLFIRLFLQLEAGTLTITQPHTQASKGKTNKQKQQSLEKQPRFRTAINLSCKITEIHNSINQHVAIIMRLAH